MGPTAPRADGARRSRSRFAQASRILAAGALVIMAGCGSEESEPTSSGSTTFELREVLELLPSGSPGFDALEVTCVDVAGPTGCLDPTTASGREVVLLDRAGDAKLRLAAARITGVDVGSAEAMALEAQGGGTEWVVLISLTPEGATKLEELTTGLVGERLAIVVDGVVVSAPMVQEPITGGSVQVSGDLTEAEARALAEGIGGTA